MDMEPNIKSCTETYLEWLETSTPKFGMLDDMMQVFYPVVVILLILFPLTDQLELAQMEDGRNRTVASGC